jgi:hypothetical protein
MTTGTRGKCSGRVRADRPRRPARAAHSSTSWITKSSRQENAGMFHSTPLRPSPHRAGTRRFSTSDCRPSQASPRRRGPTGRSPSGRLVRWFAGPVGTFAFEGYLFSSSAGSGTSVWDVETGERLLHDASFSPTCYHPGAGHFITVKLDGGIRLTRLFDAEGRFRN